MAAFARLSAHPRYRALAGVAVLAALPWITFFVRLRGRALLGCDTEPALNPSVLLSASRSIFSDHFMFGLDTTLLYGSAFPHLAVLYAARLLGANLVVANKVELAMLWSMGIIFAYLFNRALGTRHYPSLVATTLYAAGPLAYIMFNTPTIAGVAGYAITPIALVAVALGQKFRYLPWGAGLLAAILLPYASQNPAYAAMPVLSAAAYVAVAAWMRVATRAQTARGLLILAWIIGLNVWWLTTEGIGFYHVGAGLASTQLNAAYDDTSLARTAVDNAPVYLMRLATSFLFDTNIRDGPFGMYLTRGQALAPYFQAPVVQVALGVPTAFVLLLLLRPPKKGARRRRVYLLGILVGTFYCLAAGRAFPATWLAYALARLPGYMIFREPYSKFGIPLSLFATGLFAIALQRANARYARLAAMLFVAVAVAPMIVGRATAVDAGGHRLLGVRLPRYTLALKHALDSTAADDIGRYIQFPLSANYSLEAMNWGYIGPGFYPNFLKPPVIDAVSSPSVDNATNEFIGRLANAGEQGDTASFGILAAWAGIRGIIWEGDSVPSFGGSSPDAIAPMVLHVPNYFLVHWYGPLALFRTRAPSMVVADPSVELAQGTELGLRKNDIAVMHARDLAAVEPALQGETATSRQISLTLDGATFHGAPGAQARVRLGTYWPFRVTLIGRLLRLVPMAGVVDGAARVNVAPESAWIPADSRRARDLVSIGKGIALANLPETTGRNAPAFDVPGAAVVRFRAPYVRRAPLPAGGWVFLNWKSGQRLTRQRALHYAGAKGSALFVGTYMRVAVNRNSPSQPIRFTFYSQTADALLAGHVIPLRAGVAYSVLIRAQGNGLTLDWMDQSGDDLLHSPLISGYNAIRFTPTRSGVYSFDLGYSRPGSLTAPASAYVGPLIATAGTLSEAALIDRRSYRERISGSDIVKNVRYTAQTIEAPITVRKGQAFSIRAVGENLDGTRVAETEGGMPVSPFVDIDHSGNAFFPISPKAANGLMFRAERGAKIRRVVATFFTRSRATRHCTPHVGPSTLAATSWTIGLITDCAAAVAVKIEFSNSWRMTATSAAGSVSLDDSHFRAYDYANAWVVPPGRWTLHGRYTPRALAGVSLDAQVAAALALLLITLIFWYVRSRRVAA